MSTFDSLLDPSSVDYDREAADALASRIDSQMLAVDFLKIMFRMKKDRDMMKGYLKVTPMVKLS